MEPDHLARATAALDTWFTNPGGSDYRHPDWKGWGAEELERMHAALEAPDTDAALEAFGVVPGTWLSTPEQDAQNRTLMTEMRQLLSSEPGTDIHPVEVEADREAEL